MPPDIAGDLATTGGEPDQRDLGQAKEREERGDVVGIGVHLVAAPRLRGTAVPAQVMRDHPVPVAGQEQSLLAAPGAVFMLVFFVYPLC
jgi:hypothetical protein